MIQLLVLTVSVLLSLFVLYILVKHDFVLARKSLLLQEIFDTTFFAYIAFIVFGRFFYIIGEQQFSFLQVLKFFHLLKFPGLLFIGGVMGFYFVIYIAFRKKKILQRVFDIYSLSLYPIFLCALVLSYNKGYFLYFSVLIFLLSLLFLGIGIYSYKNYTLKDGTVTLLFICLVSIYTIVSEFSHDSRILFSFFTIPQLVSIGIFFVSSGILLVHEGIFGSRNKKR